MVKSKLIATTVVCAFLLSDLSYANPDTFSLQIQLGTSKTYQAMQRMMEERLAAQTPTAPGGAEPNKYAVRPKGADTRPDALRNDGPHHNYLPPDDGTGKPSQRPLTLYEDLEKTMRTIRAEYFIVSELGWMVTASRADFLDALANTVYGLSKNGVSRQDIETALDLLNDKAYEKEREQYRNSMHARENFDVLRNSLHDESERIARVELAKLNYKSEEGLHVRPGIVVACLLSALHDFEVDGWIFTKDLSRKMTAGFSGLDVSDGSELVIYLSSFRGAHSQDQLKEAAGILKSYLEDPRIAEEIESTCRTGKEKRVKPEEPGTVRAEYFAKLRDVFTDTAQPGKPNQVRIEGVAAADAAPSVGGEIALNDEGRLDELLGRVREVLSIGKMGTVPTLRQPLPAGQSPFSPVEILHSMVDAVGRADVRHTEDGDWAIVFSEGIVFEQGIGVILPRMVEKGVRVAVVVSHDEERAKREREIVGGFNAELKRRGVSADKYIRCVERVEGSAAELGVARCYYFRMDGEKDNFTEACGVTAIDVTVEKVMRIVAAFGRVCGMPTERVAELDRLREEFVDVAA